MENHHWKPHCPVCL